MPTVRFQPRPCPAAAKHHSHVRLLESCVDASWHGASLSQNTDMFPLRLLRPLGLLYLILSFISVSVRYHHDTLTLTIQSHMWNSGAVSTSHRYITASHHTWGCSSQMKRFPVCTCVFSIYIEEYYQLPKTDIFLICYQRLYYEFFNCRVSGMSATSHLVVHSWFLLKFPLHFIKSPQTPEGSTAHTVRW